MAVVVVVVVVVVERGQGTGPAHERLGKRAGHLVLVTYLPNDDAFRCDFWQLKAQLFQTKEQPKSQQLSPPQARYLVTVTATIHTWDSHPCRVRHAPAETRMRRPPLFQLERVKWPAGGKQLMNPTLCYKT